MKFICIKFIDDDFIYERIFYTNDNNPYINDFHKIFAKCVVECLNFDDIKEEYEFLIDCNDENNDDDNVFILSHIGDYIDFKKLCNMLNEYNFYCFKCNKTYTINTWSYLNSNFELDLPKLNEKVNELEIEINKELKNKKDKIYKIIKSN